MNSPDAASALLERRPRGARGPPAYFDGLARDGGAMRRRVAVARGLLAIHPAGRWRTAVATAWGRVRSKERRHFHSTPHPFPRGRVSSDGTADRCDRVERPAAGAHAGGGRPAGVM